MIQKLSRAVDVLQRAYDVALEQRWKAESQVRDAVIGAPVVLRQPATLLRWPQSYDWHLTAKWVDGLKQSLATRVQLEVAEISQPLERAVILHLEHRGQRHQVVIDYADKNEIHVEAARSSLVYFKMQHRRGGYRIPNVVPGGYVSGDQNLYAYLRQVRALRDERQFQWDVNARFGMRFAQDLRGRAMEQLSGAKDLRFQGGAHLVRYSRHLREIAQSKVCVDLPGNGDFCFRLVDYLAVGACIVARRHGNTLPRDLVDGVHVVWVKDDLSDLVETCRELVHDDERRERIALNARRYFDAHLHREVLGEYYVDQLSRALSATQPPPRRNVLRPDVVQFVPARVRAPAAKPDPDRELRPE